MRSPQFHENIFSFRILKLSLAHCKHLNHEKTASQGREGKGYASLTTNSCPGRGFLFLFPGISTPKCTDSNIRKKVGRRKPFLPFFIYCIQRNKEEKQLREGIFLSAANCRPENQTLFFSSLFLRSAVRLFSSHLDPRLTLSYCEIASIILA